MFGSRLLLFLFLFLFLSFWFTSRREKIDSTTLLTGLHSLQSRDEESILSARRTPFRFLLALIAPPVAGIRSSIQPTESTKTALHILQTASILL